jgi:type I restriction enzyme S subunit
MGQSPSSDFYNTESNGLPFFQGKAEFAEVHPVVQKWCSSPNKIADKDDILLSVRAPVGPTNIANVKCCIGRGLAAIRYKLPECHKFLFYYLRCIEKSLAGQGTGSTFSAISGSVIKNQPFPLPPLPEQRRIVAKIEELFSDLDAGIESLRKVKKQLKTYRQSVLKWAFEGKLTAEWRKTSEPQIDADYSDDADKTKKNPKHSSAQSATSARISGSDSSLESAVELIKRIKAEREKKYNEECEKAKKEEGKRPFRPEYYSEFTREEHDRLKRLPAKWRWEKAGNLFDSIVPNRDKPKTFTGDIPWITIPNLPENGCTINYSTVDLGLTNSEAAQYNARIIPQNAVIMTCIGRFGIAAVVDKPVVINQQLHAFVVEDDFVPKYLAYALKDQRQYFEKVATSTTIAYVNKTNCNSVPIPVCPQCEQSLIVSEIESRLSVADNLEKTIDASLAQAAALRQSILKRAFEGKLVPQDPKDEPAEKLLERIKNVRTADSRRLKDDADFKIKNKEESE